ncbi:MAG: AraC family transcriptional regulator [Clostridia bacterium]|jgi:hypothetical protein|nr:AraC family transcriptional regulator [Clostridia bacterium]
MTVNEMAKLIEAENMTPEADGNAAVSCGYTCDLLSWVMAHGAAGMAWVTVQTHMNVIAVASLMEMAAVIIPEGIEMEEPSLEKAKDEGICVLQTKLTAFEICARLAAAGLKGK